MMPNQLSTLCSQLKQNPIQFLVSRRLNVPMNIANDPQAILNYLMQSGQVSQSQVNAAYQQMSQFR